MNVYYSNMDLPSGNRPSIFLAGPTSRSFTATPWRKQAILSEPDQTVIFAKQVEWEYNALHMASVISFWVPRSEELPGFTTNVEFGFYVRCKKVVYGRPPEALRTQYLDWLFHKINPKEPVFDSLYDLMLYAIAKTQMSGSFFQGINRA